jgi:hypothetical protein
MHAHAAPAPFSPNASVLKPFGILAAVAFVVGFLGYLTFQGVSLNQLQAQLSQQGDGGSGGAMESPASTSGSASDEWNIPKQI